MHRVLALLMSVVIIAVVPYAVAAQSPSPFRAAVVVATGPTIRDGIGAGALTAPDEVTAILVRVTPAVTAKPVTAMFTVASRADSVDYSATGKITCWTTLAQWQDEWRGLVTAQVRIKLVQPVPVVIAAPVGWGIASGALTLISGGEPYRVTTGAKWPSAFRPPVEGYNVPVILLLGVPRDGAARGPVFDAAGRLVGVAVGSFVSSDAVIAGGLLQIGDPKSCGALPQVPPPAAQPAAPARQPTIAVRARTTEPLTVRVTDMLTQRLRGCGALIRQTDADLAVSVLAQWFPTEGLLRLEASVVRREPPVSYVATVLTQYAPAPAVADDDLVAAVEQFGAQREIATLCAVK